MAILDHRGQPVDTKKLTTEIATPSLAGVRQAFVESVTNGLTPARLGAIMAAVDQGDANDYLTLAEEIEERDPHYRSVISTRKLAITGLDVVVEAFSDDKRDVEIADACAELVRDEEFSNLVADQVDAIGKGFAVNEIDWDKSASQWRPRKYDHVDQRFFMFDRATGKELRLRDEADFANGIALEPFKFVVHTPKLKTGLAIRGGLARLAAVAFMCKSYALKDWVAFAEVFGQPLRLGKYDVNATDAQKTALLNAVANIGTDASAVIPDTMLIEFVEATSAVGGDKLYQGLADWLDRQVTKGVLGQTATTEGTPGKLGSDSAQETVRFDIRTDDAKKLAATLRRDIIRPFVDLNYGPQKNYPKLRLHKQETEDLKGLADSMIPFIGVGMRVEESYMRDKFGVPEPAEDALLLKPPVSVMPFGPVPVAGEPANDEDATAIDPKTALNGAQIKELKLIIQDVAGGLLPRESGVQLIVKAFPLSEQEAEEIMGEVGKGFKPTPPPDKGPPPPFENLASAKRTAAIALMQKVVDGAELTRDQRDFVAMLSADGADEIDRLADDSLGDWRKQMDPVTDPIVKAAKSATSYDDLAKKLKAAKIDTTELMKALATASFKARGRGAATDEA